MSDRKAISCFEIWGKSNSEAASNLRYKINKLIEVNNVSVDKVTSLVKGATSLSDVYSMLSKEFPRKQTCGRIAEKFKAAQDDFEESDELFSCSPSRMEDGFRNTGKK